MTPERWQQILDVLREALELPPDKRPAFLDHACSADSSLRTEVESLLSAGDDVRTAFLGSSLGRAPLARNVKLGDYEIESLIGAGGMGEVYRARDRRLGREVAIKVLPAFLSHDLDRLRRFEQEARAAAALNHPNVLSVFQMGTYEGAPYLVSELLEGVTLREQLMRRSMPLRNVIDNAVQIARGLAAAHEKGIVHRDLKPENLFVTKDGRLKILDFGLAKLMQPQPGSEHSASTLGGETEPGVVMGTVGYMAPEQVRGQPADHRADIFAFGAILYEMLAGKRAFQKPTSPETMTAILNEDPPGISQLVPNLPMAFQRVVHRCLEKNPEQRFQSASDLAFALAALSDSGAPSSPADLRGEAKGLGRRWIAMASAALSTSQWKRGWWLVVALIGVVTAATIWFSRPPTKKLPAMVKVVSLTSNIGDEASPTFSPDGNQIAYAWNGEKQDYSHIYVKLIGPGPPLKITSGPEQDWWPEWSPDGQTIAFVRDFGSGKFGVYLIPALGGQERKLLDVFLPESIWLRGPFLAWLPDCNWIIYTNKDAPDHPTSLFIVQVKSGETRRVTVPPAGTIGDSQPAVSPDGSLLAFSRLTGVGPQDFLVLKLNQDHSPGSEPQQISFFNWDVAGAAWGPQGKSLVFSHGQELWKLAFSNGHVEGQPQKIQSFGNGGQWPAIALQGKRMAYVKPYGGQLNIWRVGLGEGSKKSDKDSGAREAMDLIPSTSTEFAPEYSPDGKRVAFESDRTGSLEIWTCQSDGANCSSLTSFGTQATGVPHWSPDGRKIVFYSRPNKKAQIYLINSEGGEPRRLTNDGWEDFYPVWSRDGRWIYFASNRTGVDQIWKIPSDGGDPLQVTKNGGFASAESVDGKYLYYTRSKEARASLWRMPVEGGDETKIVDGVVIANFAVTAHGLYYMTQSDPPSDTKLVHFLSSVDQKTTVVATIKQNVYHGLSLSPDERWLLYAPTGRGGSNVILVENFDLDR